MGKRDEKALAKRAQQDPERERIRELLRTDPTHPDIEAWRKQQLERKVWR